MSEDCAKILKCTKVDFPPPPVFTGLSCAQPV